MPIKISTQRYSEVLSKGLGHIAAVSGIMDDSRQMEELLQATGLRIRLKAGAR